MKYKVSGMKTVAGEFETRGAAIQTFGGRLARREFGKRGECVLWRVTGESSTAWECDCFIGIRNGNELAWQGRNIHFTVSLHTI